MQYLKLSHYLEALIPAPVLFVDLAMRSGQFFPQCPNCLHAWHTSQAHGSRRATLPRKGGWRWYICANTALGYVWADGWRVVAGGTFGYGCGRLSDLSFVIRRALLSACRIFFSSSLSSATALDLCWRTVPQPAGEVSNTDQLVPVFNFVSNVQDGPQFN